MPVHGPSVVFEVEIPARHWALLLEHFREVKKSEAEWNLKHLEDDDDYMFGFAVEHVLDFTESLGRVAGHLIVDALVAEQKKAKLEAEAVKKSKKKGK